MIIITEIRRAWCWSNSYKRALNSDLCAVDRETDRPTEAETERQRETETEKKETERQRDKEKER